MENRSWSQLGPLAKVGVFVLAIFQIGLLAAALVDMSRRPADRIRGPKVLWFPVAFVNFIGPVAYFVVGRKR